MIRWTCHEKLTNDIPWDIDPNYNDEHFCENVDFSGMTHHLGKCKLYIFGYSGTIPYFYILNKNNNVVCAICLLEPKYYKLNEPYIYLGNDEIKVLYEKLHQEDKDFGKSSWEYMCGVWSRLKQNKKIKKLPKEMPNYLDLKNNEVAEMSMRDKYKTLKKQLKEMKNYMKLCKKYGIKC